MHRMKAMALCAVIVVSALFTGCCCPQPDNPKPGTPFTKFRFRNLSGKTVGTRVRAKSGAGAWQNVSGWHTIPRHAANQSYDMCASGTGSTCHPPWITMIDVCCIKVDIDLNGDQQPEFCRCIYAHVSPTRHDVSEIGYELSSALMAGVSDKTEYLVYEYLSGSTVKQGTHAQATAPQPSACTLCP